ncbi:MAG: phosphotransferase [Candidatus Bathyarchaeota archaeon]|nr:phosphotransferase [Candidatus Bathyarchaeota archaeon]
MLIQKQIVDALKKPDAYDEAPGEIELVQTHISFVFLTNKYAYKVKKAVDLGFLDFTTLENRKLYCEKELALNKRLCEDLYLEVVPINKANTIKIKGEGKTVEYAVKMRRVPQEKMLQTLLEKNQVDRALIEKIAEIIANFHSKAETNNRISDFGSLAILETNWKENFDQTEEFVGKTISMPLFKSIHDRIRSFTRRNGSLFEKRVAEGKIRDCHGDIHSGNIFVTDKIYIFDAIEFNERFRYSDVASDVAFLAMDLDFKNRADLANFLVEKYVASSGDSELALLLPFYKCYRAYVRGKVLSFKFKDPNVRAQEKRAAAKEAKAYFKLAGMYAKSL